MALTNFNQKIFCDGVAADKNIAQFGSLKAGAIQYSKNMATIQGLDAYTNGWSDSLINYYSPTIQDMNSLYYLLSRQLAYFRQNGIPEWTADIEYFTNAIVSDGLGSVYKSLVDNNLNQPFTDATKWFLLHSNKIMDIGYNYHATNLDYDIHYSLNDTTVGHNTIYLPNPTASLSGRKYRVLNVSGATKELFVYQETTSNTWANADTATYIKVFKDFYFGVLWPNYANFICDGTTWWVVSLFVP